MASVGYTEGKRIPALVPHRFSEAAGHAAEEGAMPFRTSGRGAAAW